ncbi:LOW QUALITY PROTEIN: hypothetical protein M513_02359 [Trichuris suis]|uniref:Peptidase aspartic putative domain-containing protein n=1 Tax=Trichuris suis TaxID=68888 RepID=A0A085MHI7_9BILA|nr:LOW QUALITY PROTEIN: hypothetical protein M513_02359 [Trichuris suis]
MEKLKRSRTGLKGRVGFLAHELTEAMATGKDPYLIADMEGSLNGYVTRANEIQEELERLLTDDDLLADEVNSWIIFEREVRELRAQVRKYHEDAGRKPELTKDGESTVWSTLAEVEVAHVRWERARVYSILGPAGVHSRTDLNDVTKLVYLRSALTGNALKAVEGFSVANANYSAVFDALKQRFGRRRVIIECYVKNLLELGRADTCAGAAELREFHDALNLHVRALVAFDHNPCVGKLTATDILVTMFKDTDTRHDGLPATFCRRRFFGCVPPGNGCLHEYSPTGAQPAKQRRQNVAGETSRTLKERSGVKVGQSQTSQTGQRTLAYDEAFFCSSIGDKDDAELLCAVCQNGHATVNCQNLICEPVDERWKMGHPSKSCPSRKPCGKQSCGLFHHPLLHVQKDLKEVKVGLVRNRQKAFTLLQTAKAKLCGSNGCTAIVTCLFDASAQRSFISVFLKGAIPPPPTDDLGLRGVSERVRISTFGKRGEQREKTRRVAFSLTTIKDNPAGCQWIEALCVRQIHLSKTWKHVRGLHLADQFPRDATDVDVLIGLDHYYDFVRAAIRRSRRNQPVAVLTTLNWLLCGRGHPSKSCPSRKPCGKQSCGLFHHPLLHVQKDLKEVKVGLVRNRQKAFTLLQTAKAKLCGSNGCTAIVTCLFDASAQPDDLGLRGVSERVRISTFGKRGEQREKTRRVAFSLTTIKDNPAGCQWIEALCVRQIHRTTLDYEVCQKECVYLPLANEVNSEKRPEEWRFRSQRLKTTRRAVNG